MNLDNIQQGAIRSASIILASQVRNCLEDVHVKYNIKQSDMKDLNIEIHNTIYSILTIIAKHPKQRSEAEKEIYELICKMIPTDWGEPKYLFEKNN